MLAGGWGLPHGAQCWLIPMDLVTFALHDTWLRMLPTDYDWTMLPW